MSSRLIISDEEDDFGGFPLDNAPQFNDDQDLQEEATYKVAKVHCDECGKQFACLKYLKQHKARIHASYHPRVAHTSKRRIEKASPVNQKKAREQRSPPKEPAVQDDEEELIQRFMSMTTQPTPEMNFD